MDRFEFVGTEMTSFGNRNWEENGWERNVTVSILDTIPVTCLQLDKLKNS